VYLSYCIVSYRTTGPIVRTSLRTALHITHRLQTVAIESSAERLQTKNVELALLQAYMLAIFPVCKAALYIILNELLPFKDTQHKFVLKDFIPCLPVTHKYARRHIRASNLTARKTAPAAYWRSHFSLTVRLCFKSHRYSTLYVVPNRDI